MNEQKKILVVDDEEVLGNLLVRVLQDAGYKTVTVSSAKEALAIVATEEFDLILTDVIMPEMNGVELSKALRAREIKTPVIAVTGGTKDIPSDEIQRNFSGVFYKPFSIKDLPKLVAHFFLFTAPSQTQVPLSTNAP